MPINLLQRTINTDGTNEIVPGNLTVGGTLGVTGAATFASSIAAASAAITGIITVGAGASTIGGTLSVTGAASFLSVTTGVITATGIVTGSRFQESAGTTTVTANTAYAVLSTDRYILISTTGAGGPFAITFPSITFITKVTIRMTAFNTSSYTAACNQGTVTWGAAQTTATFISNISSTTWSLAAAPQPTTAIA